MAPEEIRRLLNGVVLGEMTVNTLLPIYKLDELQRLVVHIRVAEVRALMQRLQQDLDPWIYERVLRVLREFDK